MSERRSMPGPGRAVSRGRLRVDAARAVAKLREYQLPDPTLWALEVVRAAVASGAPAVTVMGDADDVWIAWPGAPLGLADLGVLMDELVSPGGDASRRPLRLLATGVNTALGVSPRWVDVWHLDGAAAATRVRYTPDLLEEPEEGEPEREALRPAVSTHTPPAAAPDRGHLVHVRRWPGLDVLGVLLGGREPSELRAVRAACDDVGVPLTVGRSVLTRERSSFDLLRVGLGPGFDGFLAVVDATLARNGAAGPWLDAAEHGVVLARTPIALWDGDAVGPSPVRLFVDTPRLPTNASRSEVRVGEAPLAQAVERARALLPETVERLVARVGPAPEGEEPAERRRLRAAALALLGSAVGGPHWAVRCHAGNVPEPLAPLLEVPLLRDAIGRWRTPGDIGSHADVAHREDEPLPAELEPWVGDLPWIPKGDPALFLYGPWRPSDARDVITVAKRSVAARARFLEARPVAAEVPQGSGQWLSVPLPPPRESRSAVPRHVFGLRGLAGEVVLLDPQHYGRTGTIRFLHESREIDRCQVYAAFPFTAVVTTDDLAPRYDYRSLHRDDAYQAVLAAVSGAALRGVEGLAFYFDRGRFPKELHRRLGLPGLSGDGRRAVADALRCGTRLALTVLTGLGLQAEDEAQEGTGAERLLRGKSPLERARIWPSPPGGGEPRSLARLLTLSKQADAIRLCPPDLAEPIVGERPAVAVDSDEADVLRSLLRDGAALVPYDPRRAVPIPGDVALSVAKALARREAVALAVRREDHRGAVAWGSMTSAHHVSHLGARLWTGELAGVVPATVWVDDDEVVPDPTWSSLAVGGPARDVEQWQDELVRAVARALVGERSPDLVGHPEDPRVARLLLFALAARPRPEEVLGRDVWKRLREAPLLETVGGRPESLEGLSRAFAGQPVPYYAKPDLDFDPGDFRPLAADAGLAEAVGTLLERPVTEASARIDELRRGAIRRRHLAAHRATEPRGGELPSTFHSVRVEDREGHAVVGLSPAFAGGHARTSVLVEGRPFTQLEDPEGPPVVALVDLPEWAGDERFVGLSSAGERAARRLVRRGVRTLLRDVLEKEPAVLVEEPNALALLEHWTRTRGNGKVDQAIVELVTTAVIFPTVQDGTASLADATRLGRVSYARHEHEWLAGLPDEPADYLDAPIVRVRTDADEARLTTVLQAVGLAGADHSRSVARLQGERRVARGVVPEPTIPGAEPWLTLRITDVAKRHRSLRILGFGKAALSPEPRSMIVVRRAGEIARREALDVLPVVQIVVEAPVLAEELSSPETHAKTRGVVQRHAQKLAELLVAGALESGRELPAWLRRGIRAGALLGGMARPRGFEGLPLFETTGDTWVSLEDLGAQAERFGDVWTTPTPGASELPLDEGRLAVRLTEAEATGLFGELPVVDARQELALDAEARINRARPAVERVALTAQEVAEAWPGEVLEGDGVKSTFALVAPLPPRMARLRGLRAYKGKHPLGRVDDPCAWPTVCVVDDARLAPDRTWAGPDTATSLYRAIAGRVRKASEAALAARFPEPADALAFVRVDASLSDSVVHGEALVRGLLHLSFLGRPGSFELTDGLGTRAVAVPVPVAGHLVAYAPGTLRADPQARLVAHQAYRELCAAALARAERGEVEPDLATAYAAVGVVSGVLRADELPEGGVALACVRPAGVTLADVAARRDRAFPVVEPGQPVPDDAEVLLVDDGSLTFEALAGALRTTRVRAAAPSATPWVGEGGDGAGAPGDGTPGTDAPAPPEVDPLAELGAALARRLREAGLADQSLRGVRVQPRKRGPLLSVQGGSLVLAGADRRARAIAEAVAEGGERGDLALRLLLVSAVALLHHEKLATTDAGELGALAMLLG